MNKAFLSSRSNALQSPTSAFNIPAMHSNMSPLKLKTRCLNQARRIFKFTILEKLLVSITRERDSKSWVAKLPPNNYQYRKPSSRRVQRGGIHYQLDIANLVDWSVYYGMHEKAQTVLMALATPGAVVVDVGANIGETTLNFAKRAGPAGRIFAFEPDPLNLEHCARNIALNHFKNILLEPFALSEGSGESRLYRISERNPGMNRILEGGGHGGTPVSIRTLSLDEYVKANEISRVSLIKIDVEGFELRVLKGAKYAIDRFKPALFIELDDQYLTQNGDSARLLVEYLAQWPYRIVRADTGQEITSEQDFSGCHYDILCQIK